MEKLQAKAEQEAAAQEARARAEADRTKKRRSETDLAKLADRLSELAKRIGEQKAGYEFQDWFYDLMDYFMISMSGFSSTAISQASRPKTPLLLLDSQHVYAVLTGTLPDFKDLLNRLRRHASQTGESYLPMDRL